MLVGVLVRVSLSVLVLEDDPVAEAVFVKVGLLVLEMMLVTLVLGPSYVPLWAYLGWDRNQTSPAPRPGTHHTLSRSRGGGSYQILLV